MVTRCVHKWTKPGAGGYKHQRTGRSTAQRVKTAIRGWSVGIQRSRVVASGGLAIKRSWGRGGGGIVIRPFQEVHSSYPSRTPALFRVHVTKGVTG